MEKFMYLFVGGDVSHLSNDDMEAYMQRWFAWVEKLTKENRYVAGESLLPGGKTVSGQTKVVTDGPYAEGKEIVGGFFVVQARGIDEAAELAKDCPDFEYGGTVEVREVQKLDM